MSSDDVQARLTALVKTHPVVLFMKGTRRQPACGFSAKVVSILDPLLPAYETVDVLSSEEVRSGVKEMTGWPTIPQLFVNGEFVGGCDIVQDLQQRGELAAMLGAKPAGPPTAPRVTVSAVAARVIAGHEQETPGEKLHLELSPSREFDLYLAPPAPGAFEVDAGHGIRVFVPAASARAIDGVHVDFDEQGQGFRITGANEPARVKPLSVAEYKAMRDRGDAHELVDVRTDAERRTASILGSHLFDAGELERLRALPRDTVLVFQCHHGMRSQAAAERILGEGFTRVFNLTGGIDAWSQQVDPTVPRY
ncbi:MAG: Grx4 family monothiol glutaredoxin [Myxococcales bacterium]|nr:MAG: Grx4 family monothiol glutaredoxin [Myxococcales bacterium]